MKKRTGLLLLTICLLAWAVMGLAPGDAAAAPNVTINEIRIDQPGADNDEYFELAGAASIDLNDLTYIVLGDSTGGGSGVIENVTPLTGQSMPTSGYFVAAEATFTLGTADLTTTLNFENSDNVTHMLVEGFTGADGDDLDTNDDGVLDVTPWTSVLDTIALIKEDNPPTTTEWHYGPPTVGPDGSFVPGHVYYCDDGWKIGAYDPAGGKDTPGAENPCGTGPDLGACGDPATFIHDIQGDGASSPMVGEIVVIEAIVHGSFQASDELEGFFLQEEDGDADGDPKTSEGLFIAESDAGFITDPGEVLRLKGEVKENYGRTQLVDISAGEQCDAFQSVTPASITLPVATLDTWEYSEGMSVNLGQTLYATDNYNQGRYGEVSLSVDERLYNPTNVVAPGAPANAMQAANDLRRILLDDGSSKSNPDPAPYIAPDGTLRAGDTTADVIGALDYSFSTYRIQPTEVISFTRVNERPAIPTDVGGNLTVASFNVLNYFTTIDEGQDNCGPSGDLECRGADSAEEFVRQRTKIIDAISKMNADIVGLIEIENNATEAVADLVAGLNDKMGAGTYAYVDTGTIGTDAIKVAFIYKPATVETVGAHAILDAGVDPDFNDDKNRPALAQTFKEKASDEMFTAAVNHLKSKGSNCDDLGDPDTGDGQGNCNITRTKAAAAEATWLATDPTSSGDPDFLIIGDLNAYAKEDPISALTTAGYKDLVAAYGGDTPYSYVFFGQAGYLDHSLSNPTMSFQVTGTTVWHINADEPNALN